jgi:hypothetical protein
MENIWINPKRGWALGEEIRWGEPTYFISLVFISLFSFILPMPLRIDRSLFSAVCWVWMWVNYVWLLTPVMYHKLLCAKIWIFGQHENWCWRHLYSMKMTYVFNNKYATLEHLKERGLQNYSSQNYKVRFCGLNHDDRRIFMSIFLARFVSSLIKGVYVHSCSFFPCCRLARPLLSPKHVLMWFRMEAVDFAYTVTSTLKKNTFGLTFGFSFQLIRYLIAGRQKAALRAREFQALRSNADAYKTSTWHESSVDVHALQRMLKFNAFVVSLHFLWEFSINKYLFFQTEFLGDHSWKNARKLAYSLLDQ